jgi:hypothetical protein
MNSNATKNNEFYSSAGSIISDASDNYFYNSGGRIISNASDNNDFYNM